MIFDGKQLAETFDAFEKDALENLLKAVVEVSDKEERNRQADIFAFRIQTVRELRDRIRLPEIKA